MQGMIFEPIKQTSARPKQSRYPRATFDWVMFRGTFSNKKGLDRVTKYQQRPTIQLILLDLSRKSGVSSQVGASATVTRMVTQYSTIDLVNTAPPVIFKAVIYTFDRPRYL